MSPTDIFVRTVQSFMNTLLVTCSVLCYPTQSVTVLYCRHRHCWQENPQFRRTVTFIFHSILWLPLLFRDMTYVSQQIILPRARTVGVPLPVGSACLPIVVHPVSKCKEKYPCTYVLRRQKLQMSGGISPLIHEVITGHMLPVMSHSDHLIFAEVFLFTFLRFCLCKSLTPGMWDCL